MAELLHEFSAFFGYGEKQVLYYNCVEATSGGARGENPLYVKEDHRAVIDAVQV